MTCVDVRMIQSGLTRTQWPIFMKEVYRVLDPGNGWVQCIEYHPRHHCDDGSVPKDAAILKVTLIVKGELISVSSSAL